MTGSEWASILYKGAKEYLMTFRNIKGWYGVPVSEHAVEDDFSITGITGHSNGRILSQTISDGSCFQDRGAEERMAVFHKRGKRWLAGIIK